MQTWTRRPPSSKPRTRNSSAREQHNYSLPSWSPARHSVKPDRGNRCTWRRVWASVFCSVYRTARWGWFCATMQTLRLTTAFSVARVRSPSHAESAGLQTTEDCRCYCWTSSPFSQGSNYRNPPRFSCSTVFSSRTFSVAFRALRRCCCCWGCPLEIPGSWMSLARLLRASRSGLKARANKCYPLMRVKCSSKRKYLSIHDSEKL